MKKNGPDGGSEPTSATRVPGETVPDKFLRNDRERTVAPRRFSSPVFLLFEKKKKRAKKENFKKKMGFPTFLVMFVFGQHIRYSTTAVPNMLTL